MARFAERPSERTSIFIIYGVVGCAFVVHGSYVNIAKRAHDDELKQQNTEDLANKIAQTHTVEMLHAFFVYRMRRCALSFQLFARNMLLCGHVDSLPIRVIGF